MTNFVTPVGRLVGGSLIKFESMDRDGRPLIWKSGPSAGQPRPNYWFQLAIAKDNPEFTAFRTAIETVAKAEFAALGIFNPQTGACSYPDFGWKIEDGDSQIAKTVGGKPPAQREGCPGHWVVRFAGCYAPKCVNTARPPAEVGGDTIKLGDFVRVAGSVSGNGDNKKPGLFLNYDFVQFLGYGPEIQFGPDPDVAFAAPASYIPPGMSATPVAPAPVAPPPTAGYIPPPPPAGYIPPPPPASQILAGPPIYIVGGNKFTEDQLRAAGYSPEQLATLEKA